MAEKVSMTPSSKCPNAFTVVFGAGEKLNQTVNLGQSQVGVAIGSVGDRHRDTGKERNSL